MTIQECITEIEDAIRDADPRRPDYCTNIELETLRKWADVLTRINDLIGLPAGKRPEVAGKADQVLERVPGSDSRASWICPNCEERTEADRCPTIRCTTFAPWLRGGTGAVMTPLLREPEITARLVRESGEKAREGGSP